MIPSTITPELLFDYVLANGFTPEVWRYLFTVHPDWFVIGSVVLMFFSCMAAMVAVRLFRG